MSTSNNNPVGCEIVGSHAIVTIDNPPLNVISLSVSRGLKAHLDRLKCRGDIRALIVTGAGSRSFSAGSDITEFQPLIDRKAVIREKLGPQNEVFRELAGMPIPTIAALNGAAYGGGLEIALCCDFIIAEKGSLLAVPELNLGVFPSSGGTFRLARRIGSSRAKQMVFLGQVVDGETAYDWGLVNVIAPTGKVLATAVEYAQILASKPTFAVGLSKRLINSAFDLDEEHLVSLSLESSERAFESSECQEGLRAFFAKERPNFN